MPTYVYECKVCQRRFEAVRSVDQRNGVVCANCGGETQIVISRVAVHAFEPYYSPTFKRYVTSRGEKARLMRQKGLAEYTSIDECEREATRMSRQEEEIELAKGPDERFIECYNKALAEHP